MNTFLRAAASALLTIVLAGVAVPPSWAVPGDDARFAYTDAFARAKMFKSDCVGFACAPTAEFAAARRAARDDQTIVPYLEQRFHAAPRAGQVYIALVIRAHDRAKGEALLQQLAQAKGETVETMFGCIIEQRPLDKFAGGYLNQKDFSFE